MGVKAIETYPYVSGWCARNLPDECAQCTIDQCTHRCHQEAKAA
jgi:hypothetical protein